LLGLLALEESNRESALGQISLEMGKSLHVPDVRAATSDIELTDAANRVLPGFAFYDHWGSVEASVLIPKIRFMHHALGINWFVLDHLSIMVSGQADEGDERKRLDALTTKLRSLVSELNIGLHVVSHLRKASGTPHEEGGKVSLQDIRGSGAPAQLSNIVIALERNQQAEDGTKDDTKLRVLKNRFTGSTGVAGTLTFDHETSRMKEKGKFNVSQF
jgi:twinkle protein